MASQQYVTPEAAEARINGLQVSYALASLTPPQRAQLDNAVRQTREAVKDIYQQHMFNANSAVEQREVTSTLGKLNSTIIRVRSSAPSPSASCKLTRCTTGFKPAQPYPICILSHAKCAH